ncbi:BrnT family toxin [Candidatus Sumerlaeota bacterium]|nr:BrnT family toxin [Candidatus Sumerlaeota bacterium]
MKVTGIIWLRDVVDKLLSKHNVTTDEVEEVLSRSPRFRFLETGDVQGEDLYAALGQTEAGRYLIVFFVHRTSGEALVVSAREMTKKERRAYAKK